MKVKMLKDTYQSNLIEPVFMIDKESFSPMLARPLRNME